MVDFKDKTTNNKDSRKRKYEEIYDLRKVPPVRFRAESYSSLYQKKRSKLFQDKNIYLMPVGVDKIDLSVELTFKSILDVFSTRKGSSFIFSLPFTNYHHFEVWTADGERKFDVRVSRGDDFAPFYLRISFNPSHWMSTLGVKGSKKGEDQNYIAGNLQAVQLALKDLAWALSIDSRLSRLESYNDQRLCLRVFHLSRVDLALDVHCRNRNEKGNQEGLSCGVVEKKWTYNAIELLLAKPPLYSRPHKHGSWSHFYSFNYSRTGKRKPEPPNPYFKKHNYISSATNTHRTAIYLKPRFVNAGDETESPTLTVDRLAGAALRIEHRLVTPAKIRDALGVGTVEGLCTLLSKSEKWHRDGRIGTVPLLERCLNQQITRWGTVSSGEQQKIREFVERVNGSNLGETKEGNGFPALTPRLLHLLDQFLSQLDENMSHIAGWRPSRWSVFEGEVLELEALEQKALAAQKAKRASKREWESLNRTGGDRAFVERQYLMRTLLAKVKARQVRNFHKACPKTTMTALDSATSETIHGLLNVAHAVLGSNQFHLILGQAAGHYNKSGKVIGGERGESDWKDLRTLVRFCREIWGGAFLDLPRCFERAMLVDYLTFHQLSAKKFCKSSRNLDMAERCRFL